MGIIIGKFHIIIGQKEIILIELGVSIFQLFVFLKTYHCYTKESYYILLCTVFIIDMIFYIVL